MDRHYPESVTMDVLLVSEHRPIPLCSLPIELLLDIADNLDSKDHNALSRTCRQLRIQLQSYLFARHSTAGWYYPLTYGIKYNKEEIIRRAVSYGRPGQLNVPIFVNISPMGVAALVGNKDGISLLFHLGAGVDEAGPDGLRPLTHGINGLEAKLAGGPWPKGKDYTVNVDAVIKLLDLGADPTYDLTREGVQSEVSTEPFHIITYFFGLLAGGCLSAPHCMRIIKKLFQHGVSADGFGPDGLAPIHLVFFMDPTVCLPALRLILSNSATANLRDRVGRTPLEWALQMVAPNRSTLCTTKLYAHIINVLIDHGADPNQPCSDWRMPLMLAVENTARTGPEGVAIVRRLKQQGADPVRAKGLIVTAVLAGIDSVGYKAAKADHKTLAELFDHTLHAMCREELDDSEQITMRFVDPCLFNNAVVPVVLRAGSPVRRMDIDTIGAGLLAIGGWLDDIHGYDLFLPKLFEA